MSEQLNIDHDQAVLRAIGAGAETRRELKEATGFDYDVIEKALERNSGELRTKTVGMIEFFSLASARAPSNGHVAKPDEIIPQIIPPKPRRATKTKKKTAVKAAAKEPKKTEPVHFFGEFCKSYCDPNGKVGHHRDCQFWKQERVKNEMAALPKTPSVIEGFIRFNIAVDLSVAGMARWETYEISDFFKALAMIQKLGGRSA